MVIKTRFSVGDKVHVKQWLGGKAVVSMNAYEIFRIVTYKSRTSEKHIYFLHKHGQEGFWEEQLLLPKDFHIS